MKLICDLDTGIDDALAIAYALGSPDAELIGITGTYGNVTVEQGVANSRRLLEVLGAPGIPVFPGIGHPWGKREFVRTDASRLIHGDNGVGGVDIDAAVPEEPADGEKAIAFIADQVRRFGQELTIVPTGALTTIAEAMKRHPQVARARIVLMGGALTVPGNVSAVAEANISQDPDAADYVFRHGENVTMVGLDVTLQTLLTGAQTRRWRDLGMVAAATYADMVDYYIGAYATTSPGLGGCGLHDPLAVAVALDPTLVTSLNTNLKVDLGGRTIGDEARLLDPVKNTHVAVSVDADRFVGELMARTLRLFGEK